MSTDVGWVVTGNLFSLCSLGSQIGITKSLQINQIGTRSAGYDLESISRGRGIRPTFDFPSN